MLDGVTFEVHVLLIWLCESVDIVASMLGAIFIIYNETRRKLSENGNKMWEKVTLNVIVNDFTCKAYTCMYSILRWKTTGNIHVEEAFSE